jgi:preprotein translocase subunit SecG
MKILAALFLILALALANMAGPAHGPIGDLLR